MRIALSIDNVLSKFDEHYEEWQSQGHTETAILNDDAFWATLPPHDDLIELIEYISKWANDEFLPHEFWFMCERPESKRLVTTAWLRRHLLAPDKEHLIMAAIPRFDCQTIGIEYFIGPEDRWTPWYRHTWIKWGHGRVFAVALRRDLEKNEWVEDGDFFRSPSLFHCLNTALAIATQ
jgi:hypothetical protein